MQASGGNKILVGCRCLILAVLTFFTTATTTEKSPDTVEEVAVIVGIDKEVVSYAVVQHIVAVLEVVEDT